jgi:hypothetical protein
MPARDVHARPAAGHCQRTDRLRFSQHRHAPGRYTHAVHRRGAFVCCLPSEHALAQRGEIDLRELAQDTLSCLREVAPANYDNVIACLQQAGIHPHTRHAARQWLTVMALVSPGRRGPGAGLHADRGHERRALRRCAAAG